MLTRVLRTVPLDRIDRRSQLGVYMRRLRAELTKQLGGDVTPAQRIIIEEVAKKAAIVQAVGDYVLTAVASASAGQRARVSSSRFSSSSLSA